MELRQSQYSGAMDVASVYMRHVYSWMTLGLVVTSLSAWYVAGSATLLNLIFGSSFGLIILGIAVIALPMVLSGMISKLSSGVATAIFVAYSALMGAFLSSVLLAYTGASVMSAFAITAGTFAAMSIYGTVTKRDLTGFGSFLMMGLFGVLIAMVVNLFLHNTMLDFVISAICVIVFTGLTAFDTQKLIRFGANAPVGDEVAMRRGALLGALTLYLDFINLFLAILRIMGDRR